MKLKTLFLVLLSLATFSVSAQKFKPSPKFIKGETQVNIVFDYSHIKYNGATQEKYYKTQSTSWVKEWEGQRRENNTQVFISSLNKCSKTIDFDKYPKAEYTIIVDVLDCYFGTFAGPMSKSASLYCTIKIVKTGTTDVLASTTVKGYQNAFTTLGTHEDFDRMYLAFSETGKALGMMLARELR